MVRRRTNALLLRRQQSLTRRCQANTIERRAFNDQPTLSNRPIHCSLRRSFVDLQTAGDLCSMTACKAPPSTEYRATSATIRRARSS
jgi:hypothetical protein